MFNFKMPTINLLQKALFNRCFAIYLRALEPFWANSTRTTTKSLVDSAALRGMKHIRAYFSILD